ncbi:hypothetical protein [Rhodoplanes roseus]|uniref:Uncharacterized protein n=1 Tax=Rhodoplanes roseus TaxID=29409 RepID=A0A327KY58_9BRAD|nr:hypothetical protein [Rhodoplanes roseus]RAI42515.1 hypothetical protein CH341_19140 [Rhodoplanes roseus]
MPTSLIMTSRTCGVIAFATGAAYWLGHDVPLNVHVALGVLLVCAVSGLAFIARTHAPGLALSAVLCAALVPLFGLMQVFTPIGGSPGFLQLVHVIVAVSAIGAAEALNKQLKRSAAM